jgi:hypothetical protein
VYDNIGYNNAGYLGFYDNIVMVPAQPWYYRFIPSFLLV